MLNVIKKVIPKPIKLVINSCRGYKVHFGHYPNLINPATFSEKLQKYKLFVRDERIPLFQDKVLVKHYVQEKLGAQYLIPTIWHGARLPPREQRNWAFPFVIKANHGCGWNIFVRSADECNWDEIEKKCESWMNTIYGQQYGEWSYAKISPQLLVEPFISAVADLPADYKLWVFNGKVQLIQVISGRATASICQAFYDLNWIRQPFTGCAIADAKEDFPCPNEIHKMIQAAEMLADDFAFVRVDFYEVNKQLLFGEMTFFPASGFSPFSPIKYEKVVGAMWH